MVGSDNILCQWTVANYTIIMATQIILSQNLQKIWGEKSVKFIFNFVYCVFCLFFWLMNYTQNTSEIN